MTASARIPLSLLLPFLAAAGTVAAPASAQQLFSTAVKEQLPTPPYRIWIGPVVDVDGDGDLDVVAQDVTLLNDGAGNFAEGQPIAHPSSIVGSWVAGDVDGDGDADLLVATGGWPNWGPSQPTPDQNELLLNDGTGRFVDASGQLPQLLDWSPFAALGDVDGDGDLDVYFARINGPDGLYMNDGTGRFTDASVGLPIHTTGQPSDAVFGDVDGDGDLDLVVADSYPAQNRLYLNDGTGRFVDATGSLPQVVDATVGVAMVDVDGDGDLDLVFANQGQNRLCANDGTGTFIDVTSAFPVSGDPSTGVAARDVDGDGDVDLMFSGYPETWLWLNDGTGRFVDVTGAQMPPQGATTQTVALFDVDADGDDDAFLGDRLHLNSGAGTFQPTASPPSTDSGANAVAFGDLDGDGDVDYIASRYRAQNGVAFNDGDGVFRLAPGAIPGPAQSDSCDAALGDLDGDGDLDAVFIGNFHDTYLYLNDGTGRFTDVSATNMPPGWNFNECLELGDVDGDGDLDVVIGCSLGRGDRLYLNDGRARFTDVSTTNMPLWTAASTDVSLGDLDGDGDLDMVFASFYAGTPTRFYLNDGSGRFTYVTAGMPRFTTTGLDLGDADGDGDLDLATVDFGVVRLFLNDGRGGFTDVTSRMPPVPYAGNKIEFVDLDEDGDLDLVTAHIGPDMILINDGAAGYTLAAPRPSNGSRFIAAADVDGDGDVDLLSAGPELLTYNLRRHLQAPRVAVAGRGFELRVYARGSTASLDVALPFLAARPAHMTLPPLGTLGLDPATMIPVPGAPIPQPSGVVSFILPVPNQPALHGAPVHVQALIVSTPGSARLTNVIHESILR